MNVKQTDLTEYERQIVTRLIESKGVNFEAIGAALAKFGPSALVNLNGEDVFCGTMRRFVRMYRLRDELADCENLAELRQVGSELRG
jgi:hypothetical protein